ncbi:MAG TPA: tetratricopeptide repeat protein [Bryobacteraceae bacterium]|nr:tetratricopeptide repeat protein [Bryobacteraceae bacterium]
MALVCALLPFLLFAQQQDALAEGLKALDANHPDAAEALFRQAAAAAPGDVSPHFNLALALSMERKDTEAIAEFRRALQLQPGLYQANLNLGILLLRNQRAGEALPVLKEALDAQKTPRANLYYAQALDETGDVSEAESRYRTAIELDPKAAAAQAGLARLLLKDSKLTEAATYYREAASLDPGYRDGLLELGAAYEKAGMRADAIAIYREFPENAGAKERLGRLLIDNGKADAAIPSLEGAVKTSPTVANRLALADAYKLTKQPEKVIEQLRLAVASEPSNYDLRMDLGRELRDAHKSAEAEQQFTAAGKIRPDSVKVWNELATLYVVNGDYVKGLEALDRVRALGQELPGDYFFRGICLDRLRQLKPAIAAYRQFLATDGNKMPDQEFQARQRVRIMESELNRTR